MITYISDYLRSKRSVSSGFSLTEVIVSIAVIALLAAVAIPNFFGALSGSRKGVAVNLQESLNTALAHFSQANYEIVVTAVAGSTAEEMSVIRTLQYQDPVYPSPGSPYLRQDWNPVATTNTTEFRLVWAGRLFRLLEPGTPGLGLKVDRNGADYGADFVHPPNFVMAGK